MHCPAPLAYVCFQSRRGSAPPGSRKGSACKQQRGQWSGRLGFILAAAGSAIGLGNLWKFPYITHQNEGGAFVLIYIAAVILVGFPIMTAEVILGRRTQHSPVGAFGLLSRGKLGGKLWMAVGFLGVSAGFIILSYYSVVAGWTLHYVLLALQGKLAPWPRTRRPAGPLRQRLPGQTAPSR